MEVFKEDITIETVSRKFGRSAPPANFKNRHLPLPTAAEPLMRSCGLIERITGAELFHAIDHVMPLRGSTPAIATIHDTLFITHYDHRWQSHRKFRKQVPRFLKQCRAVTTGSESAKNDIAQLLNYPAERIFVTPWGVDAKTFCFPASRQEVLEQLMMKLPLKGEYFLAVSCDDRRKNTPLLLEVFWELLREGLKYDLVVVWDAPKELRQRFEHPQIHFLDYVDQASLVHLYQGSRATLFPSKAEGFGLPVLEAMASGSLVLTSHISSLPEVGGEYAIYIDPFCRSSLRAGLLELTDLSSEVDALRQSARQWAEQFTWERCAQQTLDIYKASFD
jgi:alpha-1,3-rhamnosyl/mannosyltransferase